MVTSTTEGTETDALKPDAGLSGTPGGSGKRLTLRGTEAKEKPAEGFFSASATRFQPASRHVRNPNPYPPSECVWSVRLGGGASPKSYGVEVGNIVAAIGWWDIIRQ